MMSLGYHLERPINCISYRKNVLKMRTKFNNIQYISTPIRSLLFPNSRSKIQNNLKIKNPLKMAKKNMPCARNIVRTVDFFININHKKIKKSKRKSTNCLHRKYWNVFNLSKYYINRVILQVKLSTSFNYKKTYFHCLLFLYFF